MSLSSFVFTVRRGQSDKQRDFPTLVFDDLTRVACVPIHFAGDVHHDG